MPAHASSPRRLDAWLGYIQGLHFRTIDLTLDRVRRVAHCMRLQKSGRHILVAGTNGKGSSVAYLESIYRSAGYRVGAYTSPHLVRYNERVRIDGLPVDDAVLERSLQRVESARGAIPLTYFEFGTLAALDVFAAHPLDVVILEVGMGGRLDATNIVAADVALITEIGLDHQQWLGNDLDSIAREKAGILRYRGAAVSSGLKPPEALAAAAAERRADLWQAGVDFGFEAGAANWTWRPGPGLAADAVENLPVPMAGIHQLGNAAGAVAVVRRLGAALPVADRHIVSGIGDARIPSRLQVVASDPEILLDVSHNADGIAVLAGYLNRNPVAGVNRAVFSMLADKDIDAAITRIAGCVDGWYIGQLDDERAADRASLAAKVERCRGRVRACETRVEDALNKALDDSCAGDRLVVFGSFHLVGAIMRRLDIAPFPQPDPGPDDC